MVEKKATAAEMKASAETTAAKKTAAKASAAKATTETTAAKTSAAKKTTAKTTAAKTTAAKATPAKAETAAKTEAVAKPAEAKKTTTRKTASSKAAATKTAAAAKTTAEKTATTKAAASKTTATAKTTAAKKAAVATKTTAAKASASKATDPAKKETPAKAETTKAEPAKTATTKATAAKKATAKKATPVKKATAAKKATPAKKEAPAKDEAPVKAQKPAKSEKKPEPAKAAEPEKKLEPEKQPEPAKATEPEKQPEPAPAAEPKQQPEAVEAIAEAIAAEAAEAAAEAPAEQEPPLGVLIAAAECAPLVKVGGLADVVGTLPKYLKKYGVDARVIMPFHRQIKEQYRTQTQHMCEYQASLGWRSQYVGLEKMELDGITFYFIDNEFYFGGPIYCGGEFEGEQYAFFTRAVMDIIPQLDFDVRVLHCNDWHTAMMPLLAKTQYQGGMQSGLRTILTIHNLHFQGQFSHEFDRDLLRVDDSLATPQFIEHYGCDNMLKAGIVFADKVNTVSPTYAREICDPYQGESLDGVLRSRGGDLWGILNGIDYDVWNPADDKQLVASYTADDLAGKAKVRDALLEELGLQPVGENTAVLAMVGRLTPQKGIDLVRFVLDELMEEDIRFIVLGSGDAEYEDFLRDAENRYKGRLCSYIGYNGDLSHRIYAGADLFLMPSLFEPCGISQMISMRYGTLPIVRETGGLNDTVAPYNEYTGEGTGFSFANYDAGEMLGVIRYALQTWRNPDARAGLIKQAMESDFSFDRSAGTYAELYRSVL